MKKQNTKQTAAPPGQGRKNPDTHWWEKIGPFATTLPPVALLLWILSIVFDMKGTIGEIRTNQANTSARIEGIVKVLPDMRIKIAREEITKRYEWVVITTKPKKINSKQAYFEMALHNLNNGHFVYSKTIQKIKSDDPTAESASWSSQRLITGPILDTDPNAITFQKLQDFSSATGKPVELPPEIDLNKSFLFMAENAHDEWVISSIPDGQFTGKEIWQSTYKRGMVSPRGATWEKVSADLEEKMTEFRKNR